MLNRSQLILLTAMATLGGSFAGFLAVGIAMGDITLALINLGVIVALFSIAFVIGSGRGEIPEKKLVTDIEPWKNEVSYSMAKDLTGANGIEAHKSAREIYFGERFKDVENPCVCVTGEDIFIKDKDWSFNLNSRRAGDIHVGGELNPEFKDTDEGIENLKSAAHECGKAIGDFADSIARDFGLSQKKPQICSICLKDAHNSVMDIETYYEGGIIFKRARNYPNHKAIWFCDDHKRESFIYNRIG